MHFSFNMVMVGIFFLNESKKNVNRQNESFRSKTLFDPKPTITNIFSRQPYIILGINKCYRKQKRSVATTAAPQRTLLPGVSSKRRASCSTAEPHLHQLAGRLFGWRISRRANCDVKPCYHNNYPFECVRFVIMVAFTQNHASDLVNIIMSLHFLFDLLRFACILISHSERRQIHGKGTPCFYLLLFIVYG